MNAFLSQAPFLLLLLVSHFRHPWCLPLRKAPFLNDKALPQPTVPRHPSFNAPPPPTLPRRPTRSVSRSDSYFFSAPVQAHLLPLELPPADLPAFPVHRQCASLHEPHHPPRGCLPPPPLLGFHPSAATEWKCPPLPRLLGFLIPVPLSRSKYLLTLLLSFHNSTLHHALPSAIFDRSPARIN